MEDFSAETALREAQTKNAPLNPVNHIPKTFAFSAPLCALCVKQNNKPVSRWQLLAGRAVGNFILTLRAQRGAKNAKLLDRIILFCLSVHYPLPINWQWVDSSILGSLCLTQRRRVLSTDTALREALTIPPP